MTNWLRKKNIDKPAADWELYCRWDFEQGWQFALVPRTQARTTWEQLQAAEWDGHRGWMVKLYGSPLSGTVSWCHNDVPDCPAGGLEYPPEVVRQCIAEALGSLQLSH